MCFAASVVSKLERGCRGWSCSIPCWLAWGRVPLCSGLRGGLFFTTNHPAKGWISGITSYAPRCCELHWLNTKYATILAALVAPLSRGTVTLASTSANDLPIIDPNWLTSSTDQQVAINAYKRLRQAFASKAMSPVLADKNEYFPGSAVQTDAQILNIIKDTVHTVWHACCTNKMGKSSDPMAVVDSNARVFGVKSLRVVDSSAFALLPPGHPQSTVYALAEKISAQILAGNWGLNSGIRVWADFEKFISFC